MVLPLASIYYIILCRNRQILPLDDCLSVVPRPQEKDDCCSSNRILHYHKQQLSPLQYSSNKGTASANIEIEKTEVAATTIHNLFDFDNEYKTKLDFSKLTQAKVATLMMLDVLLLDEVSMLDTDCFSGICNVLSIIDHSRRPEARAADCFGPVHVILFGDFKQLPPCSSQAPFIVMPAVVNTFDFRCLRENRRVVQQAGREQELEEFHQVLTDISLGIPSNAVARFLVGTYVRGASIGSAELADFEGSTAVFTKRRYRDRWNRIQVRKLAKKSNHSIKIKAKVRARGTRSQQWYAESRVQMLRKKCRTQSLWNLHLAGDWHYAAETEPQGSRPHMMRLAITLIEHYLMMLA